MAFSADEFKKDLADLLKKHNASLELEDNASVRPDLVVNDEDGNVYTIYEEFQFIDSDLLQQKGK